jgi:hypothetical protein
MVGKGWRRVARFAGQTRPFNHLVRRIVLHFLFADNSLTKYSFPVEVQRMTHGGTPMKAPALIVLLSLSGIGLSHQALAVTATCGCNAKCDAGYLPTAVTKCVDEHGTCLSEKTDNTCTLTCKKGTDEKKVTASCAKVYTARPVRFIQRKPE